MEIAENLNYRNKYPHHADATDSKRKKYGGHQNYHSLQANRFVEQGNSEITKPNDSQI
jgi:hypothetical protein